MRLLQLEALIAYCIGELVEFYNNSNGKARPVNPAEVTVKELAGIEQPKKAALIKALYFNNEGRLYSAIIPQKALVDVIEIVSLYDRTAENTLLTDLFDGQKTMETRYQDSLEQRARYALGNMSINGPEFTMRFFRDDVVYGLIKGIFIKDDVKNAVIKWQVN